MELKRCFKCLRDLPVDQFYRHRMMADGRLSKCVECAKRDVREHRVKNVEKVRAYDRARASQPQRADLRKRVGEQWDANYPERATAHNKAAHAARSGKLTRPDACEGCNKPSARLEKHHPDYSRPLIVAWLCKPCHAIADKMRRLMETA